MNEPDIVTGTLNDFISLSVADGGVRVCAPGAGSKVIPWGWLCDVLTAHPAATFVVEDVAAVFGQFLLNREGVREAAWGVLNECRVLDVGLAAQAFHLVGRQDADSPVQNLLGQGARLSDLLVTTANRFQLGVDRANRYGYLGHGLRVRAGAALGSLAENRIQLKPEARERLIRLCQVRVDALEGAIRKSAPDLGGHLGRSLQRPESLLSVPVGIANWLDSHLARVRDVHGAAIGPFLELTNETIDFGQPDAWPLWGLGAPGIPQFAGLIAAARLWRDLAQSDGTLIRPAWDLHPRFRVKAFDLEAVPGVNVGEYITGPAGYLLVRVSFRPLVSAAVMSAVAAYGYETSPGEPAGTPLDLIKIITADLGGKLPAVRTSRQRADLAEALICYLASAGGQDGLKEYVEVFAGVDTTLSAGDYGKMCRLLCHDLAPELQGWLGDHLIDWVERSLPTPPTPGTLRQMITPQAARSRAIAEHFAKPEGTWGGMSEFRFYRMVVANPQWGLLPQLYETRGPLENHRLLCTRNAISPAGLVRPALPWWANRGESWRMAFDEAAFNVITRLEAAGNQLAWVSDRGIWLNVPVAWVVQEVPQIVRLANKAAAEMLERPCHLAAAFAVAA
jgi:hypothetical protein